MILRVASFPLVWLLIAFVSQASAFYSPSPIEHDFKKPAFISFLPETGPDAMLVTSFDILCSDCKLSVVNTSTMQTTTLASLNWPNAVTFCPAVVCAKPSLLVTCPPNPIALFAHYHFAPIIFFHQVGFGFLVPGHSTGGIFPL